MRKDGLKKQDCVKNREEKKDTKKLGFDVEPYEKPTVFTMFLFSSVGLDRSTTRSCVRFMGGSSPRRLLPELVLIELAGSFRGSRSQIRPFQGRLEREDTGKGRSQGSCHSCFLRGNPYVPQGDLTIANCQILRFQREGFALAKDKMLSYFFYLVTHAMDQRKPNPRYTNLAPARGKMPEFLQFLENSGTDIDTPDRSCELGELLAVCVFINQHDLD